MGWHHSAQAGKLHQPMYNNGMSSLSSKESEKGKSKLKERDK